MGKPKNPNPQPKPKAKLHVELSLKELDRVQDAREQLIASILKVAPQSPLYAKPGMKDAVDALGKSLVDYKQAGSDAAAQRKQLGILDQTWADTRHENDTCLVLVKTLTEKYAANETDITGMALTMRGPLVAPVLEPVESIDIKMGKKGSGTARVLAHETGPTKWHYAAQSSPDPMGPNTWTDLVGDGKQRKLEGKSGTSIWVRFARKRGDKQTEWSAPVLVTLP